MNSMNSNTLQHWGIKGMKWGIRRYQNKDGSLTPAGEKRYADSNTGITKPKKYTTYQKKVDKTLYGKSGVSRIEKRMMKGYTHKAATQREYLRNLILGTSTIAGTTALSKAMLSPKADELFKLYFKAMKSRSYEKEIQKAQSSLARIGTYTYRRVAKDVYERVMR